VIAPGSQRVYPPDTLRARHQIPDCDTARVAHYAEAFSTTQGQCFRMVQMAAPWLQIPS